MILLLRVHFLAVLKTMKATYMDLLGKFCKGKKFLKFKNSWFFHVHLYFDDELLQVEGIDTKRAKELKNVWGVVMKHADECKCLTSVEDQRIILVTLSSIFYELMSAKIKGKKNDENSNSDTQGSPSHAVMFNGSMVSLYRYSGFALHSMIETRKFADGKKGDGIIGITEVST